MWMTKEKWGEERYGVWLKTPEVRVNGIYWVFLHRREEVSWMEIRGTYRDEVWLPPTEILQHKYFKSLDADLVFRDPITAMALLVLSS